MRDYSIFQLFILKIIGERCPLLVRFLSDGHIRHFLHPHLFSLCGFDSNRSLLRKRTAYFFALLLWKLALIEAGGRTYPRDRMVAITFFFISPFLVNVHLLHNLLDGCQLVNLHLQVPIVLVTGLVVQLR
jgi:hypothetical protein